MDAGLKSTLPFYTLLAPRHRLDAGIEPDALSRVQLLLLRAQAQGRQLVQGVADGLPLAGQPVDGGHYVFHIAEGDGFEPSLILRRSLGISAKFMARTAKHPQLPRCLLRLRKLVGT